MSPLLQTDMRCQFDAQVTCSDASQTGGAAAESVALTWWGRTLLRALSDQRLQAIPCPVLVMSVFNGKAGAFRIYDIIYDILGVRPCGKVSIETHKDANRVTRTAWPDVEELHDVETLTGDDVLRWANLWPRAREVHVWAGFPCVHLSRVRTFRQNLEGEGSKLFWTLLTLLGWIKERIFPSGPIQVLH